MIFCERKTSWRYKKIIKSVDGITEYIVFGGYGESQFYGSETVDNWAPLNYYVRTC